MSASAPTAAAAVTVRILFIEPLFVRGPLPSAGRPGRCDLGLTKL
ncbi:hypothetical protein [Nocardioides perillae]|uniref:Uncharacterized protein n=1 Tax=Nocardioides perillae TaxID=1119534 RepID=A0A7Y9UNL0_9ACTN|nr:hypothetical protein [Nocardioides perillae]NYG56576.1 hypothetical protein [Nocardioides perillae]